MTINNVHDTPTPHKRDDYTLSVARDLSPVCSS
jgi:hypothetical protein